MRLALLAIALVPAACRARPAELQDPAGFVVTLGDDTVLVERAWSEESARRGRLTIGGMGHVQWRAEAAPEADFLEASLWTPHRATGAARYVIAAERRGESGTVISRDGRRAQRRPVRLAQGTVAYLAPSIALLERVIGARGELDRGPSVLLLPLGRAERVSVRRSSADSVVVWLDGNEWRLRVDDAGRVLGGTNATRGWSVRRVARVTDEMLAVRPWRLAPAEGQGRYGAPAGAPYRADEVRIPTREGHVLAGTLTVPVSAAGGGMPAVLLVSGSSPQDRDMSEGDSPYRPFRELADTLSRLGIAVLRVDDRGVGASTGDFASSSTEDRARDARASLDWLRSRPGIDSTRIAVLGMSEGGVVAPMLAADGGGLRAIVLLGAPGSDGHGVAQYQTRWRVIDNGVPASGRDSAIAAQMAEFVGRAPRDRWVAFFLSHDPLEVARRVRTPVLVLHGENDHDVDPADAERLGRAFRAAGNVDVTVRVLPGVNHPMMRDPDGNPTREMYLHSASLAPEVVAAIVDWLPRRLAAAGRR